MDGIDFNLLRELMHRAERSDGPLQVRPTLPFLDVNTSEGFEAVVSIPETEGKEYEHWRLLGELDLVRASHDGRPGFGKNGARIEAIKPKGWDFLELSRDDAVWERVLNRCERAGAASFPLIVTQLRKEARRRIRSETRADDKRRPD